MFGKKNAWSRRSRLKRVILKKRWEDHREIGALIGMVLKDLDFDAVNSNVTNKSACW